jgi:hypothetical protein
MGALYHIFASAFDRLRMPDWLLEVLVEDHASHWDHQLEDRISQTLGRNEAGGGLMKASSRQSI